ncbi:MAG TPA: bifunctional diguanylate cyclase/phosphodiesterase [Solirubrobacteraceae bacterium]|nr:bifunctional diguanylate cyclase/phosphodiesterase [Solirubrobacteraceae bacterium]
MTDSEDLKPNDRSQANADGAAETGPVQSGAASKAAKRSVIAGGGTWAAVAIACVLVGTIASVLGGRALASHDSAKRRAAFAQSSAAIASTSRLAIQREEELGVSGSTFLAAHPKASQAEFTAWAKWGRTLRRYPELDSLSLLTVVRAPELAAFQARVGGPAGPAGEGLRVVPVSGHRYYCLALGELVRSPGAGAAAGQDYCAAGPALLVARNSGQSSYTATDGTLAIATPVYRGNVTPRSVFGRKAASVGWLRTVLTPEVVLRRALVGHPGYGARLRYGGTPVAFTSGAVTAGSASATIGLHDGWILQSFGPATAAGVLADASARALLIGGILLSALVGLLVFVLGTRGEAGRAARRGQEPEEQLYDALTGLPNRALTLDRAERMIRRAGRDSGMLAGALFVDVDRLEDVNEMLGTQAGDQLLGIVGERLEGVVREHDTVGRLGGDEFVVLVESSARGVRLDSLARRMIEALHKPVELDGFGPSFVLTASIGVAFGRYESVDDMLRDAHLALTSAKTAGKDRYTVFNANMRTVIEGRAVLEAELNAALRERQFFLVYQPVFELSSRRVTGVEALIRWRHPSQGVVAPGSFLALAEETGLIVPIGRWILEEACTRAAAWNVAGHQVGVSVKVSAHQLGREGFATDVRRALQQSGIEPSLLTLEIDETSVLRDAAAGGERLRELKGLGVRIGIDGFGNNGYAHHSDLRRMPIDALRVDRVSLAESEDEAYRSWLLEAILVVGRELSLAVVATEIETHEQLEALQALGCTMAQGDLLGKPATVDEVESLFEASLPAVGAGAMSPPHQ